MSGGFTTQPTSDGVPLNIDPTTIVSESTMPTTDASGKPTTEEFVTTKQGMYIGLEGAWTYHSNEKTKALINNMMAVNVVNEMYSFSQTCMQQQKDADQAADQ